VKKLGVVLALLVLVSALTVGTGTVREVKADGTTQYFILVDGYTQSEIEDRLSQITWADKVPSYTVSGNVIYFQTREDMLRFLAPYDLVSNFVFQKENIKTSIPVTQIFLRHYTSTNKASRTVKLLNSTKNGYIIAHLSGQWWNSGDYHKSYLCIDDTILYQVAPSSSGHPHIYKYEQLNVVKNQTLKTYHAVSSGEGDIVVFSLFSETPVDVVWGGEYGSDAWVYTYESAFSTATFHLTDALTGQSLTGVTVKEGDTVLGTLDDGGTLELVKGTHTLTFEKTGYWSVTKTVDVQADTSVSVEMYPSSAAFKLENFPADISIPEHTIYELTFTLSPIDTSATYNTYLSLPGLSDVLEVRKDGSVISPEGGKYYLGDISGPTQVSIKFKASSVGTYAFSLTLESHDAFGTKTYTTTKQVSYKVDPLPFTVEMPSEWQVGDNQLRISEASGQSYAMVIVLKDQAGSQVWSDSYAFNPYDVHTFTVNVPKEGTYTLEFQWAGKVASYTINVGTGISLLTKSVSVKKGGVGTVQVQLKNPSDSTKYYTIKLEGGFLDVPVNQTVAIAPSSTKTVSIAFAVPDNVQFDAYDLTLKVLEGDAVRYSDTVHVIITGSEGSGLLPIGGGSSGSTLLLLGAAAAVGLVAILAASRRG